MSAKPEEIEAMVKFALDKFGRLDVLHNNAMFSVFGLRTADIDLRGWQNTLNVSLTAYWYGIKVAINEAMLPQGKGVDYQYRLGCWVHRQLYAMRLQCCQGGSVELDPRDRDRVRAQGYPLQRDLPGSRP